MFEDEEEIGELEKWNRLRCLQNILAAEEHLSLEDKDEDLPCSHIWCARKHILTAEDHMREAVEHDDGDMESDYKSARKKLHGWLNDGDVRDLRRLRNWLRGKFRDVSLKVKCDDGICHYDNEGVDIEDLSMDDKENGGTEEVENKVKELKKIAVRNENQDKSDEEDDNPLLRKIGKKKYTIK